ncbi:MAG: 3-deoxy-7-phosphoheptulonate synthase [Bacteroidales bacterium]|nr:3-deoxy-7-phosphoheptulonate synthase [Bacteroidales bacterium]
MIFKRKLPIPKEIKEMYPISPEGAAAKRSNDEVLRAVLSGESKKLLVVIGPCSADREDAVIEYISRLRPLQDRVADKIVIVPRIYTNKPRTTGAGYKGMLHQPNPQAQSDMLRGLISIRKLHMRAINETGFSCADEMLYPEHHRFVDDVLSYVAVGARSVEDQQHRMTASGLDIPVGMKNPTGGDLSVMMNALKAAQSGHMFIYRNWEVESKGNPFAHAILRGYVDSHGIAHPNYHYEDLARLSALYQTSGLVNPAVLVDTNHSNSGKRYEEQVRIAKEVLHSTRHSEEIHSLVKGLMIESYLVDGCQKPEEGVYGKSITDPCLGWEKTERLILDLADLWV